MSQAIETTTSMATFEGALDEDWCHTADEDDVVTACGMRVPVESFHDGDFVNGCCTGCGRRACPECEREEASS